MQTMDTVGVHVPSTHDEESETWLLLKAVTFFSLLKVCKDLRIRRRHSRILSSSCILFLVCLLMFAYCIGSSVSQTTLRMTLPPSLVSRVDETNLSLLEHLYRLIIYQLILVYGMVSSILYLLKHRTGLNTNRGICVVISIARNCGSTTTSNVFCRNIDNSFCGEGKPFQLQKLENRYFWTNEEVTNNGLTDGCLLEYRDGMCCQSLLGRLCKLAKRDGKQFIFCRNLDFKPLNVDKLLLDLQDDESVYGGLKEAHGYVNLKTVCWSDVINPASEHCVVVARARNCGSTTNIYCRNIDNSGSGVGKPFQLRRSENTSFWTNKDVENEGIKVGCVVEYRVLTCYQSPLGRYCKRGKRDGKPFIFHRNDRKPLLGINELLKDLQDKNVFRRLEQACGYVNLKANRFQGLLEKLYTKHCMARTRIYFIGIRAFTIKDERVILETMGKEVVDMPLNCRESLVLSTAPVHVPLERPRKVADDDGDDSVDSDDSDDSDDHDVPGVAVVKIEACEFTCEGLISRYKPLILSIYEEPVDIMNASGSWIRVQGRQSVCFDTGNNAAACISEELLQELDLEVDWEDTVPVHLAGADAEFPEVKVELKIRQHHFEGLALVGAVPEGLQLLVGMEIIKKLHKLGYTLG